MNSKDRFYLSGINLEGVMGNDVFLSYSSANEGAASKITAALERWGIDVWIAPDDISGGRRWGEAIVHAIQSCEGVVFLSSEQSHASEQTEKEIGIADDLGKPIIPVRLDEADLPAQFRYHLAHIQWIDTDSPPAREDYERITRAVDARCSDISITPPKEIKDREAKIAEEVASVLRRNVSASVVDFEEKSGEFVEELRESVVEQRNSYVAELYNDGERVQKYVDSTQGDVMAAATDHLIQNYNLIDGLNGVPWVPGRNKVILHDTNEWEESSTTFEQLDSGYYLNLRIGKDDKKNRLEEMAETCGLSVRFDGKW